MASSAAYMRVMEVTAGMQPAGNVSFFNGNQRLSFIGLSNNINQQNFVRRTFWV